MSEPIYDYKSGDVNRVVDILTIRQADDSGNVSLFASDPMSSTLLNLPLDQVQTLSSALVTYCQRFAPLEWWHEPGELREFALWCKFELAFSAADCIGVMIAPNRWTREYGIYTAWTKANNAGNEQLKQLLLEAFDVNDKTAADVINDWAG